MPLPPRGSQVRAAVAVPYLCFRSAVLLQYCFGEVDIMGSTKQHYLFSNVTGR
jgi:hypothetical protein